MSIADIYKGLPSLPCSQEYFTAQTFRWEPGAINILRSFVLSLKLWLTRILLIKPLTGYVSLFLIIGLG